MRSWRRLRGLTQKQLASAAHLPRTYISRIENGRILPGLGTLERVAVALHVNLPVLLERQTGRRNDGCAHQSFAAFGFGKSSNGNGNGHGFSNGNGHSNGNGNGHSNGNGHGNGNHAEPAGDQDFLRQMLRYTGLLSTTQRAVVLARVRQLAGARS